MVLTCNITFVLITQNNCAMYCTEKFIKVMQRVGLRLQEVQVMENEGLLAAKQ